MSDKEGLKWARRVEPHKVRRLYELDARGIVDEELVDEVGYAMFARCESIRIATEAHHGRVTCRRCGSVIERDIWKKDIVLVCGCGWKKSWGDYLKSYQRKQLVGGNAYPSFLTFLDEWPRARGPRDKMLAIDRLIHACHLSAKLPVGRPAATNLIEGTSSELAVFLDELAYGPQSTPGVGDTRAEWQRVRSERAFPGRRPR
jgi:hypothetical protein